jgi:hypothetical protein
MSVVTMPTDLTVGGCNVGQARYDLTEDSDSTGHVAARVLGPPRWMLSLQSLAVMSFAQAGKWEAMLYGLRGRINHLAAFDPGRPTPAGTLRGSPVLAAAVAAGDTSATLSGGTNGTLLTGDWLQLGTGLGTSQAVKVMADATSSPAAFTAFSWDNTGAFSWDNGGAFTWGDTGTVTVTFEPPTRSGFPMGTPVAWDHPLIYCKAANANAQGSYAPGYVGQGSYALDLLEAFQ